MFLRPQHLQAGDRYWSELVATSLRYDNPYNYGLRLIEISDEALANGQVQVSRLQARLRDGLILDLATGQEPDRLDLKEIFATESEVTIYLAIPKLRLGRPNVGERFEEVLLKIPDESRGGNEQEIQFQELRVVLATSEMPGYESLPIARVQRSSAERPTPVLDPEYFPPLLCVEAWETLQIGILREIYDFVGRNIELFSQRVRESKLSFSSQDEQAVETLLKLNVLNQAYAVLHCLTFARGVHPFHAFTELCRVVGMLSIFHSSRRPPEFPNYDHDDLATIFRWVQIKIRELVGGGGEIPYEQRPFEGRPLGMRVAIKADWLHSGWQWFVGVNGRNVNKDECRKLLEPGVLDWKMGSESKVDTIFQYSIPDVEHDFVDNPPTVLPIHQGWIFYEIRRNPQNAAWKDVLAEQTLALRFADHYLGNKETLVGQKFLQVNLPTKQAVLEFALFAVPSKQKS